MFENKCVKNECMTNVYFYMVCHDKYIHFSHIYFQTCLYVCVQNLEHLEDLQILPGVTEFFF